MRPDGNRKIPDAFKGEAQPSQARNALDSGKETNLSAEQYQRHVLVWRRIADDAHSPDPRTARRQKVQQVVTRQPGRNGQHTNQLTTWHVLLQRRHVAANVGNSFNQCAPHNSLKDNNKKVRHY